eukprot:3291629-Ditylum_brightwellii.AAC.1
MERKEYMHMPAHLIQHEFLNKYDMHNKIHNGYIYMEIGKGMYGLPQAGKIAKTLLKKRLANHGYRKVKHTPGLWKHDTRPVTFTLVVDDFGIKFVGNEHINHLIKVLKHYYTIEIDWT